jgi:hypothetical protein
MNAVKLPCKYGSPSHTALKYAAMKKRSVATVDDLMRVFPSRFEKPSRIVRFFQMFLNHGLVIESGDGWQITPRGLEALRNAAPEYKCDKGFDRK